MAGFFVGATVVTLLQWVRTRERRLLPLLALFLLLAWGYACEQGDPWRHRFHVAAGGAGLALVAMLSPRHPARP
jgi:hypothetical protein